MKTFFLLLAATTAMLVLSSPVFADVFENFNGFVGASYGTYTYNGFRIVNGLGNSTNACGSMAIRLRDSVAPDTSNQPYIEYIGADGNGKDGGVGMFSFLYRHWDGDPLPSHRVSVSINGGPYDSVGAITTVTLTCLTFSYTLNNASDNIKIRVQRIGGERLIIDDFFIGDFSGADTTRPTITSLTVISTTQLDVLFSEPVQQASAETPGNYVVTPGSVSPSSAVRDANTALVHLTFATAFAPNTYTLAVSNVQDLAGNPILPGSTQDFEILGPPPNIIFTEIMPNPNFAGTADSLGEWFEIYNAENYAVNLSNWVVADNAGRDTLEGPISINPGQYFVFCSNGNPATNGGVPVDFAYRYATSGWGLSLSNSADQLSLRDNFGRLVASLNYTTAFPFAAAHSAQLRDLSWNPAVDTNWCQAQVTWPEANNNDFGTPRLANDCSMPAPDTLSICILRQQDTCGVPLYLNQRVFTRGVVTFADTCRRIAYLQDGGCAIAIFGIAVSNIMNNSTRAMAAGDSIQIEGPLTQFNGLTEISTSGDVIPVVTFISSGHSASPVNLACNLIATTATSCDAEAYESRLVRVGPVTFVGAGGNFTPGDRNFPALCGTDTIVFRVDSCDALLGTAIPTEPVFVNGVLGQYDPSSCFCSGYQINYAGGSAFTPAACATPEQLTVYRDGTNNTVTLRWTPGPNQTCNCYEIYYATSADAVFPAGYTYLNRVIGVLEYTDVRVFSPKMFYVVTAGGPNCP